MSDSRTKALMIAGQCWCDPETSGIEVDARLANSFADRVAPLLDEIDKLRDAIRRLAEQDATLSLLCKRDGSQVVTVTMDATLTPEERDAVETAALEADAHQHTQRAATLRGLLERMK